ncbi:MAG: hypothetical protein ACREXR_16800 [Gammaproteobacteria bacterium]
MINLKSALLDFNALPHEGYIGWRRHPLIAKTANRCHSRVQRGEACAEDEPARLMSSQKLETLLTEPYQVLIAIEGDPLPHKSLLPSAPQE